MINGYNVLGSENGHWDAIASGIAARDLFADFIRETEHVLKGELKATDQFCYAADDSKNLRDVPAGQKASVRFPHGGVTSGLASTNSGSPAAALIFRCSSTWFRIREELISLKRDAWTAVLMTRYSMPVGCLGNCNPSSRSPSMPESLVNSFRSGASDGAFGLRLRRGLRLRPGWPIVPSGILRQEVDTRFGSFVSVITGEGASSW